ncbi:uncharacterized protein RHOBADRAFT_55070 [Rhodotorula graminis WP1]|uniref:Uncharacterized protein n=1 Tax=Rhodotorula graminis (strain WP1) TaxID=578459 RepID=A0A0P9FCA2_RHOGW|nr:uncharacterized protein RHOBADRAFT_55070 [Rhodotorula graminis WP1]KPV73310.1 hypothetical protein RHOBADRAFT_55070 [Rhodotorula graminis WP1]
MTAAASELRTVSIPLLQPQYADEDDDDALDHVELAKVEPPSRVRAQWSSLKAQYKRYRRKTTPVAVVAGLFGVALVALAFPLFPYRRVLRQNLFPSHDLAPPPLVAFNDSTPAPERFRLLHDDLRTSYTAGDVLLARVASPGPDVDAASWLRLSVVGERGQRFSGIPTPKPAHGWVVPLLEPGNYSLSVRLVAYDIPDWRDRRTGSTPGFPDDAPPIYAHCYNDTVIDGEFEFEVLPLEDRGDVFERARAGVAALPPSVRAPEMDVVGTLAGKACYHGSTSLWGWWSGDRAPSTYHAYSGCRPLSTTQADTRDFITALRDTSIRWIHVLGDSNSRNFVKDGLPVRLMLIPRGTYPPEQEPDGVDGTCPCIYGVNPKNGKDEQFLCLLFPKGRTTPLIFSHAWFSLADNDSEPLDVVYRRTLREAYRDANHTAQLLNEYYGGRFGRYDERIFPHTVETLLAPWPELLNLTYADHTLVSFGSHNTEATSADWTAELDNLMSIWPRSKHEPELVSPSQPRREDLSFVYTTPVNSFLIPEKFGRQFIVRNNNRNEARNELAASYLSSHGYLAEQAPSRDGVKARAYLVDFYGSMHAMQEVMHDAVHFNTHNYAVHTQLVLDHVVLRAAGAP